MPWAYYFLPITMNVPGFLPDTLPYIDTLYDYGAFLARTGERLGVLPAECACDARIAIIGAGISGLVAASELLRAAPARCLCSKRTPRA